MQPPARRPKQTPVQPPMAPLDPNININTGRGLCPSCGWSNIMDVQLVEDDRSQKAGMALLLGCFCLWPLLFLAPFVGRRHVRYGRRCCHCGHQWPII